MPNLSQPLINQTVRDLEWVIFSPPLITEIENSGIAFLEKVFSIEEENFFHKLLTALEKNPSELIDFIQSKNTRLLGKYFEALLEYALIKSPYKKLIASNLQINSNGKTIGELDFIYRNLIEEKIIHLEAAGKFFIAINREELLGPNPNDSLEKKIDKIKTNQISLSSSNEGKEELKSLGIDEEVFPRALIKGYLFYPNENNSLPNYINPNHMRGNVLRENDFKMLKVNSCKWKILDRKEWVSPFATKDEKILCDLETLREKVGNYFAKENYPLLISKLESKGEIYLESERYFIISNNWPKDFNNGRA